MTMFWDRKWQQVKEMGNERDLSNFHLKWPKLSSYIPQDDGLIIVDFGCGDGMIIKEMMRINPRARYIGLDVSKVALQMASTKLPDVEFYKIASDGKFPLEDESVDFIFTSEVIEHVYDTEYAFSEMSRILHPGGRILLSTPHHGFVKNLLIVLLAFDKHFNPTGNTIRYFSKRSLFSCLKRASLKIVTHEYYGRFFPIWMSIIVLAEKI